MELEYWNDLINQNEVITSYNLKRIHIKNYKIEF